ncbi:hypothetical protein [Archangium lansingense]|uniref:Uncharacterized protein n=1 Tax=Archangium lansingense TaxID=2995310 RepID=A0ABT4APM0_9BACT|nr:hypothetical protein [Archangium lansinium]MCY1083643.1 hypothetical protein [Archangium lansinium]
MRIEVGERRRKSLAGAARMAAITVGLLAVCLPAGARAGSFELEMLEQPEDAREAVAVLKNTSNKQVMVKLVSYRVPSGTETAPLSLTLLVPAPSGGTSPLPSRELRLSLEPRTVSYVNIAPNAKDLEIPKRRTVVGALYAFEERAAEAPLYKALKLTLGQVETQLSPLITTWALDHVCDLSGTCAYSASIPLATMSEEVPKTRSLVGGRLYNEHGMITELVEEKLANHTLTLSFNGLEAPGKYTGKIKVGDKDVDVDLKVSRHWGWALAALLAGTFVFVFQRYLGIHRSVAVFRKRKRLLLKQLEQQRKEFQDKLQNTQGLADYDIQSSVQKQLEELDRKVLAEARSAVEPIDEQKSEAFKALVELEKLVPQFASFAEPLRSLATAHESLSQKLSQEGAADFRYQLTPPVDEPLILVKAGDLLKGAPIAVDTFVQLGKDADAQAKGLGEWGRLAGRLKEIDEGFEELSKKVAARDELKVELEPKLDEIRTKLQSAKSMLGRNKSTAGLNELLTTAQADLDQVGLELDRDSKLEPKSNELTLGPARGIEAAPYPGWAPTESGQRVNETPPGVREHLGLRFGIIDLDLRMIDVVLILIALLLAVAFEIDQLYSGHVWGYKQDFAKAFLTGYCSQGLVAIVHVITGRQASSLLQQLIQVKPR